MKKIFFDTNFLVDLLVRDEEYRLDAKKVIEYCLVGEIEIFISFLSVANFAYIMRKDEPSNLKNNIRHICSLFFVISNTDSHLLEAMEINCRDYEDAVQYAAALNSECDCLITRNKKDFKFSRIPIFTPKEFLENIQI